MNPRFYLLRCLQIDFTLTDDATEARLHVVPRAAETVVEVEMAERRVEIILPQQSNDASSQPDTFWIACRTAYESAGFRNFVHFALLRRVAFGVIS